MVMSRPSLLTLAICLAGALSAQSKKELQQENQKLQNQVDSLNQLLSRERQNSANLLGQLTVYKDRFEETTVANSQLEKALAKKTAYSRATVSEGMMVDSVYSMLQEEFKHSGEGGINRTADVQFSRSYFDNCLTLKSLEILFSEEINVDYQITGEDQINGLLKNRYYPDYGKVEFHVQKFRGIIDRGMKVYTILITEIDGKPCEIKMEVHPDSNKDNKIIPLKGQHLFYTRRLKLADMEIGDCR